MLKQTLGQTPQNDPSTDQLAQQGLLAAILAYLMWGFLPLYFQWMAEVPALEMLASRVIWSVPFGFLIVMFRRQLGELFSIFSTPRHFAFLTLSGGVIAMNWLIYILAVQDQQMLQASLGYYINPLMYVVVGVWVFGEKLNRPQWIAVVLAAIGVLTLVINGAQIPWYALGLAVSFTIYGVVRKQVAVGAMPGLLVETLLLAPFALIYMVWLASTGQMIFLHTSVSQNLGLILGGPFTVLPLLFFSIAARRLRLSAIGFLQFMAPTIQFALALYSGESLSREALLCFVLIWLGVVVFAWDALRKWRPGRQVPQKVR